MKNPLLALGLLLLLTSATVRAAEPSDYKDIVVVDARQKTPVVTHLAIRLVVFDPPGHFREGLPVAGTQPMPWQQAYLVNRYFGRYSIAEIEHYSSRELISQYHVGSPAFAARQKYEKPDFAYEDITSLWVVYCRLNGRELAFWVVYDSGWLDKTPMSALGLKYGVGIDFYEKIDGIWKNQTDSATGICPHLPLADRAKLTELLNCGKGILKPVGYTISPVKDETSHAAG